jgi:site-specific recombinase XerD
MTTLSSSFPVLLQNFFSKRLIAQRQASPRTVASYRDTFRLFLRYAQDRKKKPASTLTLADLDAPLILGFLDHLERERHNTARTRNARLSALRSFLHYTALYDPATLPVIQRSLAIPTKRFDRPLVGFLSREEMEAILAAPERSTWSGHRDHVLFATMYNTGARVSEIVTLKVGDAILDQTASVRLHGKGRKERAVPLWKSTAKRLKEWLPRLEGRTDTLLFPNAYGQPLTRSGVENRLRAAVAAAAIRCPSLRKRQISPHVLRHTTAMHLLQSGVDLSVIALWLGHENQQTTHLYIEADLAMKERALKKLQSPPSKTFRFRPTDRLLTFLDTL